MTAEITGTVATEIGDDLAQELEPRLRGQLVRPTDDDYNEARLVWNGMVDKRPASVFHRGWRHAGRDLQLYEARCT
jgi:hypothetical protein